MQSAPCVVHTLAVASWTTSDGHALEGLRRQQVWRHWLVLERSCTHTTGTGMTSWTSAGPLNFSGERRSKGMLMQGASPTTGEQAVKVRSPQGKIDPKCRCWLSFWLTRCYGACSTLWWTARSPWQKSSEKADTSESPTTLSSSSTSSGQTPPHELCSAICLELGVWAS